jgi:hypothetical protein
LLLLLLLLLLLQLCVFCGHQLLQHATHWSTI